jgi:hypothetical protein
MLCRMNGQALISLLSKCAFKPLGMIRSMKMSLNLPLATKRRAWTASRNACMTDSIAKMVRDLQIAFREGLTAHREYERLISKGVRHDPALRASLGVPLAQISHTLSLSCFPRLKDRLPHCRSRRAQVRPISPACRGPDRARRLDATPRR